MKKPTAPKAKQQAQVHRARPIAAAIKERVTRLREFREEQSLHLGSSFFFDERNKDQPFPWIIPHYMPPDVPRDLIQRLGRRHVRVRGQRDQGIEFVTMYSLPDGRGVWFLSYNYYQVIARPLRLLPEYFDDTELAGLGVSLPYLTTKGRDVSLRATPS